VGGAAIVILWPLFFASSIASRPRRIAALTLELFGKPVQSKRCGMLALLPTLSLVAFWYLSRNIKLFCGKLTLSG
jgi:hypothetical protein